MKKILLVSDSHGNRNKLENLVMTGKFDFVLFAGDGLKDIEPLDDEEFNIVKVAGNCDIFSTEARTRIVNIEGVKFLLTHGHLFNAKRCFSELVGKAKEVGEKVVCFGHTHTQLETIEEEITLINAGAFAYGHYVIIEVNDGEIINIIKK